MPDGAFGVVRYRFVWCRLRSPRILLIERPSQTVEVRIEGNEADRALKESLAAGVVA